MEPRIATALLVFGLLFCTAAIAESYDFDFYHYVLMWPGAYCAQSKKGCCLPKTGPPAEDFFVSGLMTYSKDDEPVTKCTNTSFYKNLMSEVNGDLYKYWATIKCPSADGLSMWRSDWKTYGVCSNLTQVDYFNKGLELRAKVDLITFLKNNGIVPSTTTTYSVIHLEDVISTWVGASVTIRCSTIYNTNKYQLYEVHMCVDTDASTFIDCPTIPRFTCSPRIHFLPFSTNMLKTSYNGAEDSDPMFINPIKMTISE
ncbi:ribonuclease 3-like [Magnolia sinica]|uniref:ribonuclease 3-like n=1 Tax=Magnolia sinica TaxID=86752 RepID=UPI0026589425|nr:ribonuclease 3-like [Magnolia sinica]